MNAQGPSFSSLLKYQFENTDHFCLYLNSFDVKSHNLVTACTVIVKLALQLLIMSLIDMVLKDVSYVREICKL